jgi:hypothetical protein
MEEERCPSYTNQQGSHMSESEETPEHLQYQEDEEMIHGEHEDDVELKATMRAARDKEEQQIKEMACIICGLGERCTKFDKKPTYCGELNSARRVWEKGYRKIDLEKLTLIKAPEFMDCAANIKTNTDVEKCAEPWIFGAKLIEAQLAHTKQQLQQQTGGQ